MNRRIWLSALAIRLIKHVTLAVGLLTPAQSVWAQCDAEREIYIEKIRYAALASQVSDYDHSRTRRSVFSDEKKLIESLNNATVEDMQKGISATKNSIEERRQRKWGQITASNMQGHEAHKERLITESEFFYCIRASLLAAKKIKSAAVSAISQGEFNNSNAAQQQSQQSQQLAQQNQARADQERQGKRKTNSDAAQAHSCIEIDKEPGLFGGFKNTCDYKVHYDFCNFKPKKDSWASSHDCEKKHGIGADAVGPGKSSAAHNRNTEMVYWFACKDPSWAVDSVFVLGKGIEARCHN